jgi:hypothetical protein
LKANLNGLYGNRRKPVKKHGYNPTHFVRMLDQHGALDTARHLLKSAEPQEGQFTLWKKNLLHLSIEALALDPRFQPLFSSEELACARQRLEELGYSATGKKEDE